MTTLLKAPLFTPEMIQVQRKTRPDGTYDINTSVIVAGDYIRINRFKNFRHVSPFTKRKDYTKSKNAVRSDKSIKRAKTEIQYYIHSNFPKTLTKYTQRPVWATLTYPDGHYAKFTNRESHIRDMNEFIKILRKRYGNQVMYLAVMELTKKGNVHWHLLIFDMPRYDSPKDVVNIWIQLNDAQGRKCHPSAQDWKRIGVGYKNARQTASDLAGYLSKYLSKAFEDYQMSHTKLYLPSKNLKKPVRASLYDHVVTTLEKFSVGVHRLTYESPEYEIPKVGSYYFQVLEPDT